MSYIDRQLVKFFGTRQYTSFVILSRSRTGSNLLVSLLNSHPEIRASGESFVRLEGANSSQKLKHEFGRQPWGTTAKGFKLFYYHPVDNPDDELWQKLRENKNIHIIHLVRNNMLEMLVSQKIAKLKGEWLANINAKNDEDKQPTITLERKDLQPGFEKTAFWQENARKMFADHPFLEITYEALTSDQEKVFKQVSDFLHADNYKPTSNLRKQNTRTMKQTIRNYDDLKAEFADSRWIHFFND